jgi:hypothetical protein
LEKCDGDVDAGVTGCYATAPGSYQVNSLYARSPDILAILKVAINSDNTCMHGV